MGDIIQVTRVELGDRIMSKRPIQCAVCFVAVVFWAAAFCEAEAPTTDRQIAASLRQTVSVDFADTPLDEVVNMLRELLAVNIVLDDEGDDAKFINLQLRNVPASSVLRWVTYLARLDYTVTDHAIYIGPRSRIARMGRVYFRQYDVTDLLVPLEGGSRSDDDNDDDDGDGDDDDDDNNTNGRAAARDDLMELILLFTGGPSNWDRFAVTGTGDDENGEDLSLIHI